MSLLSNANDSIELVKTALDAKVALATAEEKERLADAKLALADLKLNIAELKEQNEQLSARLRTKNEVVYDDEGRAWVGNQAHCGGCLGSKDKMIVLRYHHADYYTCPACKMNYGDINRPRKSSPVKPDIPITLR